jgi:predicted RecB family nuclease
VTTQFSVHVCDEHDHITHHEYLADPTRDCRRELTDKLLEALHGTESIVVYHASFERERLLDLAELFQDLTPQLLDVIERLFDLEAVIRRSYYHPGFRGSYSIKRVLPVLVPDLSYAGLPIGDGDTAVAKFARMAMGQYDAEETAEVRQQLLDYCELDTLAMVRMNQCLLEIAVLNT